MLRSLLAALLLAAPAVAQSSVTYSVGPSVAPVDCPFTMSFTNDTSALLITNLCPYQVYDESGALVFTPGCFLLAILVPPGGTFTAEWDQADDAGVPFAPGKYRIDFTVPEVGIVSTDVEISTGVQGAISTLGEVKVGETRTVQICAPDYPNQTYFMMAAGINTGGIPTCGGTIPLDADAIFQIALVDTGVFGNFFGTLDENGRSTDPFLAVPDLPSFQGVDLILDFVVLDLTAPCPVDAISEPLNLTVQ
ncbi:MAG: hypothetical protein AAF682_25390 [Planctomycetota bacterium]